MIGASGLSDGDDGLKWKIAESAASEITLLPLVRYRHFQNLQCVKGFFKSNSKIMSAQLTQE